MIVIVRIQRNSCPNEKSIKRNQSILPLNYNLYNNNNKQSLFDKINLIVYGEVREEIGHLTGNGTQSNYMEVVLLKYYIFKCVFVILIILNNNRNREIA